MREGVKHFWYSLYSVISHASTNCSPCLAQLGVLLWQWCNVCDVALTLAHPMTCAWFSAAHTHTHSAAQTHSKLRSCCCAASELSKLISFTSTAPPRLSSSIYHHSLHHSFSPGTQQPLQSSPPHIYNKSIPLFASWGVCLSKWLSGAAWYFAAELRWIINSQLSVWMKGVDNVCVHTHFPLVLQGEGAWWELLAEFWVTKRQIYQNMFFMVYSIYFTGI